MKKKLAIGLILVMLFSLFPQLMVFSLGAESVLAAGTSLATLEEVKGGVFVKKGGGTKEFKGIKGMALAQGDSVRTDKEGSATLAFTTGSKMNVGPNTSFTIDKAQQTKDSGGKVSVKLKSGSVWNKVKSLMNVEDEYQIETPTTVMGVRGTLFLASVNPATGETTGSVMEGAVGVHQNNGSNTGLSERVVPMGNSIRIPTDQDEGRGQPPEPSPLDMIEVIDREDPSILAKIAQDTIERLQELQQQSQSYLAGYENTNSLEYLQAALQLAEISTQLADLTEQFMSAIEGTEQEQQMNEILQEYNTNVEDLRQQVEQLSNEVQEMKDDLVETAQEAGINPEEIGRLLQNAPTASASAGAGTGTGSSPIIPPPQTPPATPSTPPAPPSTGGGDDDGGWDPGAPEFITGIGKIEGVAKVGEPLTAGAVTPEGATVAYQWQRAESANGPYSNIQGATGEQYTIIQDDAWKFIRVVVEGTGDYIGPASSDPVLVIGTNFASGNGTAGSPYLIENPQQLSLIRDHLDGQYKYFKLNADIDFSIYEGDWEPIGTEENPFNGSFDGNGRAIDKLTVNINEANHGYSGLFGYTGTDSVIKNVTLTDVNITGVDGAGGLVGFNRGLIENSQVSGRITQYGFDGGETSSEGGFGGLVGINNGSISYSNSSSSVSGNSNVGGLVGYNNGPISYCYSYGGSVEGVNYVGGLIGYNEDATITHTFAANPVDGVENAGGLIGYNYNSNSESPDNILGSYWDSTVVEISSGGVGLQGRDQIQFILPQTWDFLNTWGWDSSSGYPYLKRINDYGLNLTVASVTENGVTFTWTVPQDTLEFKLEYSQDLTEWLPRGEEIVSTDTTVTVFDLTPGFYYFRLFVEGVGFEGYSKIVQVTLISTP